MLLTTARTVATGVGAGRFPRAPGTFASALAALVGAGLVAISPAAVAAAAVGCCAAGVWALTELRPEGDPGWVVIDEIAGQLVALLGLARPAWPGILAAFLLFRAFDIAKPGPVGWLDRKEGPLGVMGDDIAAGLMTAAVLALVRWRLPGLLE
ncbi:MAG TPA: phosphatidylglycerophosphatase A [Acetobacteraceae bacterium]|nr:phosphatidylglycerophosphatase A [Acetobacteraceae bacterium]